MTTTITGPDLKAARLAAGFTLEQQYLAGRGGAG